MPYQGLDHDTGAQQDVSTNAAAPRSARSRLATQNHDAQMAHLSPLGAEASNAWTSAYGSSEGASSSSKGSDASSRGVLQSERFRALAVFRDVAAGNTLLRAGCPQTAAVQAIQHALSALGHDAGPVDGLWGPKTHAALQAFQARHGLAVDGVLGTNTMRALDHADSALGGAPAAPPKGSNAPDRPGGDKGPMQQAPQPSPAPSTRVPGADGPKQPADGPEAPAPTDLPDTSGFDAFIAALMAPSLGDAEIGPATEGLFQELGLTQSDASPAQRLSNNAKKADGAGAFSPQYRAQQWQMAFAALVTACTHDFQGTYPASASYKGPPQDMGEASDRLSAHMSPFSDRNKPLSEEERTWIYRFQQLHGLTSVMASWRGTKGGTPEEQAESGIRAAIASVALSQVGMVEAHQWSGEERKVGSRTVKVRKGGDRLLHYFEHTAPNKVSSKAAVLDSRIPVGRRGKNAVPSWCGIFALWVQNVAGNGGGQWGPPWAGKVNAGNEKFGRLGPRESPKMGDIAYAPAKANHMATVIKVEGDTVWTVDGNTTAQSVIAVRSQKRSWWASFFRAVPKKTA